MITQDSEGDEKLRVDVVHNIGIENNSWAVLRAMQ